MVCRVGPFCDGEAVPPLAFSALDALLGLGLAVAGFLVVALVCAAVLAMLHVVLPSTDSGAAEIDRLHPPPDDADQISSGDAPDEPAGLDSEVNA